MPQRNHAEPDLDLGSLTAQLLRSFHDVLFAELHRHGHPDLRPRHGAVFAHISPKGTRASELALRSATNKQTMALVIDELEALGYVERRPDPSDRRARLVVPLARGRDEMRKSRQYRQRIEDGYRDAVGSERYAMFLQTLNDLVAAARAQRGELESADGP